MKRLLISLTILGVLLGGAFAPVPVYAIDNGVTGVPGTSPIPTRTAAQQAEAQVRNSSTQEDTSCWDDLGKCIGDGIVDALSGLASSALSFSLDVIIQVLGFVASIFFRISQFLLWLSALLLDTTIKYLVLGMGKFVSGPNASALHVAWQAIRDLINLAIIGGFVVVGIGTILQTGQYHANKFLSKLIIAAFLVNFSYFFAGAMIDASNFVTAKVYESRIFQSACIVGDVTLAGSEVPGTRVSTSDLCQISDAFMVSTKLGTLQDLQTMSIQLSGGDNNFTMLVLTLFGTVLLLVAGFVFFATALLLIARFVVLVLLLVTSPVGIAGSEIPFMGGLSSTWWKEFTSQVLFAPVYMILLSISFIVIKGISAQLNSEGNGIRSLSAVASTNASDASSAIPLILAYTVAVAFMWLALTTARSMSSSQNFKGVYDFMNKNFGHLYGDAADSMVFAPVSGMYDATLGQILGRLPGTKQLDRSISSGIRGFSKDAFGARGTYAERKKMDLEADKARRETRGSITKGLGATVNALRNIAGVKTTEETLKAEMEERAKEFGKLMANTSRTADEEAKFRAMVQALSAEQLAQMSRSDLKKIVGMLTDKQIEDFMKSDKITRANKDGLFDERFKSLDAAVNSGNQDEMVKILKEMSETEAKLYYQQRRQMLNDKKMNDRFIQSLNGKQSDAIHGSYGTKEEKKAHNEMRLGVKTNDDGSKSYSVVGNAGKLSERELDELPHGEFIKVIGEVAPSVTKRRIEKAKTPTEQKELMAAATAAGVNVGVGPGSIAS